MPVMDPTVVDERGVGGLEWEVRYCFRKNDSSVEAWLVTNVGVECERESFKSHALFDGHADMVALGMLQNQ